MDITLQELKTMKAKQLRRIIREAIDEVLREADISPAEKAAKEAEIKALQAKKKAIDTKLGDISSGREKVAEGEIEEMARTAKGFRLADPNFDSSPYANKRVSGASMADIINFFRENPGTEKSQLQSQFGFVRPQVANAVVNGLLDAGVLVKLDASGEVEATPEPGEERPETIDGPEALFIGSGDLSQYFDAEPNAGGEEDFNAEEEPTAGEISGKPVSASGMSDKDYEAFMKYSDLKQRLDATKSNITKTKRSKGSVAGDIRDTSSSDIGRLQILKKSLEDKIDALVASSDYLKKKTGQEVAPPEIKDVEDEEPIAEAMDEYVLRKLQYYAGIRK
jgi:hypothetical protein